MINILGYIEKQVLVTRAYSNGCWNTSKKTFASPFQKRVEKEIEKNKKSYCKGFVFWGVPRIVSTISNQLFIYSSAHLTCAKI